jgi:hypothetical protein
MKFQFQYITKADEVLLRGSWDGYRTHRFSQSTCSSWEVVVTVDAIPKTTCEFYVSQYSQQLYPIAIYNLV